MADLLLCPFCGEEFSREGVLRHIKRFCKANLTREDLNGTFDSIFKQGFYHPDMKEGKDYVICKICQEEEKPARIRKIGLHIKKHKITFDEYKMRFPDQKQFVACVVYEKYKQTCLIRLGIENPFLKEENKKATIKRNKDPEFRKKVQDSLFREYGVRSPSQIPEVAKKISKTLLSKTDQEKKKIQQRKEETCIKNHGVSNPMFSIEIKEKKDLDFQENHGYANPGQVPEFQKKMEQTSLKNHGVPHPSQNPEIAKKISISLLNKTSEERMIIDRKRSESLLNRSEEEKKKSLEKARQTCIKNHGVSNPMQNPEIAKKVSDSFLNKTPEERMIIDRKISESLLNRSEEEKKKSLEKARQTSLRNYGTTHPMKNPKIAKKVSDLRINKTPEEKAEIQRRTSETFSIKSEIFSYIGRNGDTRYLRIINKPESLFDSCTPDNVVYTGDKVFHVETPEYPGSRRANPDFIVWPIRITKKIIEIFGIHTHSRLPNIPKEEAEKEKIAQYASAGYKCLIIWDDDLNRDPEKQVRRAKEFCGEFWDVLFEGDISFLKKIKITRENHKKIFIKNIENLIERRELTEELQSKKIKICNKVVKELSLDILRK